MVGSLGDPDPSDRLFHSSWHNPPSMITIQMMVRERNSTAEHMSIAAWTKHTYYTTVIILYIFSFGIDE